MPFPPLCEPGAPLTDAERIRTARHLRLAGFGEDGQRRLAAAHVAVVGAGGLGSPIVLALAAAGVGTLTIIDDDDVELTNLHRQVMHRHQDVGQPKVDSAVRIAQDLAPQMRVLTRRERLTSENAATLLGGAHLVLDGTDNFATRATVAAACEELGVPLVWGVIQEFNAQVTVFWSAPPPPAQPVVLADLYPPHTVGELPSCAQVGVLGSMCLQVGALMSSEAIKLITGIGEPLLGRVAIIDVLAGTQVEVPLRPAQYTPPIPAAEQSNQTAPEQLDPSEASAAVAAGAIWLDVREPDEVAEGGIPGATLVPLRGVLADPGQIRQHDVVVICHSGARAQTAAAALNQVGKRARVLAGGMSQWPGPVQVPAQSPQPDQSHQSGE